MRIKPFNVFGVVVLLTLFQCSEKRKSENQDSESINKKSESVDPCKMAFNQLINVPEGLERFKKMTFNFQDYLQLKNEFPDIENYYKLSTAIRERTIDPKIVDPIANGGQFDNLNFFLKLYTLEKESSVDKLKEEIDIATEDEFNSTRQFAINNSWAWKDIQYNDCNIVDYYRKKKGDNSIYTYANQSFILPDIKTVELHPVINGEVFPINYKIIKTMDGWKICFQVL